MSKQANKVYDRIRICAKESGINEDLIDAIIKNAERTLTGISDGDGIKILYKLDSSDPSDGIYLFFHKSEVCCKKAENGIAKEIPIREDIIVDILAHFFISKMYHIFHQDKECENETNKILTLLFS